MLIYLRTILTNFWRTIINTRTWLILSFFRYHLLSLASSHLKTSLVVSYNINVWIISTWTWVIHLDFGFISWLKTILRSVATNLWNLFIIPWTRTRHYILSNHLSSLTRTHSERWAFISINCIWAIISTRTWNLISLRCISLTLHGKLWSVLPELLITVIVTRAWHVSSLFLSYIWALTSTHFTILNAIFYVIRISIISTRAWTHFLS